MHWGAQLAGHALRCVGVAQLADMSCVPFGRPSCGRAFRVPRAPNLGKAILKTLPPS
jgi:hypothetical protein